LGGVLASHRLIVAGAFRIAGFVLGVPSLLATLGCVAGAFLFGSAPGPDKSPYLDTKTYGPTGALANGAHAAGNFFSFLDAVATSILVFLAIFALAVTLFGVLLYVTGRGLKVSAAWSRVVAVLISVVSLASCAISLTDLTQDGEVIVGLLMVGLGYVFWVLIWRYADPPAIPDHTTPAA
jgi:hypothetical protein